MNKLIVILGDIATGKSRFANIIKDRFNLAFFDKDSFKETISDAIGFKNEEDKHNLSVAAINSLLLTFENVANSKVDILIEANFNLDDYHRLLEVANKYNYEVLAFYIYGDPSILYRRYINRIKTNRHPVHNNKKLTIYDEFARYTITKEKEFASEKLSKINADNFNYQIDETLFNKIKNFIQK